MLVQYQFIETDDLFIQKYTGDWSTEHYKAFLTMISKEPLFNKVKKILTDLRNVTKMNDAFTNIEQLQKIRRELIPADIINIQIVDKPTATAAIHLYQQDLLEQYSYSYCSTVFQALKKLNLSTVFSEIEIEDILKNPAFEFSPFENN